MTRNTLVTGLALVGLAISSVASAAPVTLTGLFVNVGVSDRGTMGSNGNAQPGMQHDPGGTGSFNPVRDYLSPGNPHESFSVNSDQTGYQFNDNNGDSFDFVGGAPAITVFGTYDNAAIWTGVFPGLQLQHIYYFNDGDERVNIQTTLTALTDLTNLAFGRSVDPDPDSLEFGTAATINTRGNGTIDPEDLVTSRGSSSGRFLGLLNRSGDTYAHNTGINGFCCGSEDPYGILPGYGPTFPTTNNGDFGLEMAWMIGSLAQGQSAILEYAYVFGDNIEDVEIEPIPEPATMMMMGLGLVGIGAAARRRRNAAKQ